MKANWAGALILLGAIAVLIGGLSKLVELRFESGEAYPLRSSMRPDPLGSKVLYESYLAQTNLKVERNFVPFNQKKEITSDAALLLFNVSRWDLYRFAEFEVLKEFVKGGGRVVVAMNSDQVAYQYIEDDPASEEESEDESEPGENGESDSEADSNVDEKSSSAVEEFWGEMDLFFGKREADTVMRAEGAPLSLPASLPWRKGGAFETLGEDWSPLYLVEEEVVAAQRDFGDGKIILLTDDYLFSNEGLLKHRYTELLVWILGAKGTIIFDETHLGVAETIGIAKLIRRYRLSGFFIVLFLLLILIVWRGASPLLPPFTQRSEENVIHVDHSSEAGLADLLRRSVPLADMPGEAFRKWKATFIRTSADEQRYADELAEIESVLQEHSAVSALKSQPLKTHLKIKSIINRRKRMCL